MDIFLIAARLVLACTFAVAAAAKLLRPTETAVAMRGFGLPATVAQIGVWALPIVELALAVLLLPAATATAAGLGLLVLLLAFSAVIVRAVVRGDEVRCNCFGSVSRAAVSGRTIARNAVIALPAGLIVAGGPGPELLDGVGTTQVLVAVNVLLVAALAVVAAFGWSLLRQQGRMLLRLDRLEVVAGGRPQLRVFTDPKCEACRSLASEIPVWRAELAPQVDVVATTMDRSGAFWAHGTPSAVLVGTDGRAAAPVAAGAPAIRELVDMLKAAPHVNGNGRGQARATLADFALPDVDGKLHTRASLAGRCSVIVFWDPSCGFCHAMLDDLRAVDHAVDQQSDGCRLVVVSTGDADAGRALALAAPVLLDSSFAVARSVGAAGTPSAVLVDDQLRITSNTRVGSASVLDLLAEVTS